MKFLALLLALLPAIASADFVAGRVRVGAFAQMKVLQATGLFMGTKEVGMVSLVEDGKGLVAYRLVVDGQMLAFKVTKVGSDNGCGVKTEAVEHEILEVDASTVLELNDLSRASCDRVVNYKWEATVETRPNGSSQVSTLVLGGNPEALAHTM